MNVKIITVIYSHLNDIVFENGLPSKNNHVTARCNFIKWLLAKYRDLTQEINPEEEYDFFLRMHREYDLLLGCTPNPIS